MSTGTSATAMETIDHPPDLRSQTAEVVRFLHAKGWTPATSSNFSCRLPGNNGADTNTSAAATATPGAENAATGNTTKEQGANTAASIVPTNVPAGAAPNRTMAQGGFHISMSGLDKGELRAEHFMAVDFDGIAVDPTQSHIRPSAETLLHSVVYRLYPNVNTVLHTHSINGTVLSKLYEPQRGIMLKNFEILKAFEGIITHNCALWLPIFPNAQDMAALSAEIEPELQAHSPVYGFLLAGHGLYTWGETPAQAKRHVEAFEFLFDCILRLKSHGYADYS